MAATEALKDLDNLRPIDHAVIARPHTPVYKMHRYFARRPWSVFRALIEHYSNPGSIILDPFCGGGVTVVEGLRLGRKAVGVDLSPVAILATWMETTAVDLTIIRQAYEEVVNRVARPMQELFSAKRSDKSDISMNVEWFEWTNAIQCPHCSDRLEFGCTRKLKEGSYKCPACHEPVKPAAGKRLEPRLIKVAGRAAGDKKPVERDAIADDANRLKRAARQLNEDADLKPFIPDEAIPDANLERESALFDKGICRFRDFFTDRQLLANALLLRAIVEASEGKDSYVAEMLAMVFADMLRWSTIMCYRKKGKPVAWGRHDFWPPEVFVEIDVLSSFANRFKAFVKGKKDYEGVPRAKVVRNLTNGTRALDLSAQANLVRASSRRLPLPNQSIDAIITDPPYGGSVNYLELANFWTVWHHELFGISPLADRAEEAIADRHRGFAGAKDIRHYRQMLHDVFAECHRVLKPNRWLVMTFHNREFKVWNALNLAAHDAGFVLAEHDGMIYQPSIKAYDSAVYLKRSGSMLGDFLVSFQKADQPTRFKAIEHAEVGRHIEQLAGEAVVYHNGATLSQIYMKLIPWLLNNNLLEKIGEREVVPFLTRNFQEIEGKWHLKDDPDKALRKELEEYSQQHYKTTYSDAMRTVPVEARLEFLIRRLLYKKGQATQDEILNEVYTNLINSNAAEYGEIQRVLNRIAEMRDSTEGMDKKAAKGSKKRKVWRLKEDVVRERLFEAAGVGAQPMMTETREESDHDLAIARLVEIAGLRGLKAHIGKTEQVKYTEFRRMTSDLPQRVAGMPKAARDIIEQIDVLWHNGGKGIVAAIEVERTTTIVSGIDRFRNLLAAAPEAVVELFIVVPKARGNEVRAKIGSPANRADGLHKRIKYIYLEDLQITAKDATVVQFEKIVHVVNGNGNVPAPGNGKGNGGGGPKPKSKGKWF